jgi:hypothetical protein
METSLHRSLKVMYAGPEAACEVRLGRYRIDAVVDGRLIEVQHSSLGALRRKLCDLLQQHDVLVIKPLASTTTIVRRDGRSGRVMSQRKSPKSETIWDLFHDLVHFTAVFPHPRLTLDVVLVTVIDERGPRSNETRRRWRKRDVSRDRLLERVEHTTTLRTAADLIRLLPSSLPSLFTTADLAEQCQLPRWWAQKIAYVLRHIGAIEQCGHRQRSRLYRLAEAAGLPHGVAASSNGQRRLSRTKAA